MEERHAYTYRDREVAWYRTGEGKPLVVLHGWGSSSEVMMPLARSLDGLRSCWLLDFPGFGNSPEPAEAWSLDDYAALVRRFMEDQDLQPADLLVHSFGGRIALKLMASDFGRRHIDKVLITGGAGMKPRRSLDWYLKTIAAKALKAPFQLLPAGPRSTALERLRGTRVWKALGSGDYRKTSGVMRETFVRTVTEYQDGLLAEIPHEVLLLWGTEDGMTPLYQAERMEQGLEGAALVTLEGAGHYAFLDRPDRFARIARAFFEG